MVDLWIETHGNHELIAEAYLLRGDTKVAQKHYFKALFDYEAVANLYPASNQFHTALEREFEIARIFDQGTKRRFLGMRLIPATDDSQELYIRIQERAPGSDLAEKASLALADHYYRRANMLSAATAYDLFLDNYPRSVHREQALRRLIQANLATFKGPRFDPTGLIEASERLESYRRQFPAAAEQVGGDTRRIRIDESLAAKDLYSARWYERRDQRRSAVYIYRRVIRDYPQTAAAALAIKQLRELGESAALIKAEITPASENVDEAIR